MFDYNIALIGFMGTGKSTIAKSLSKLYSMQIIEMDQLIEEREKMSIPMIFEKYGESYFRDKETELLIEMQKKQNVIISCGGGVVLREQNVKEIKKNGRIVLLTAQPETILTRVQGGSNRPLLNGNMNVESIRQMMDQRRGKYEAAADVIVQTDNKDAVQISEELVLKLQEMTKNG